MATDKKKSSLMAKKRQIILHAMMLAYMFIFVRILAFIIKKSNVNALSSMNHDNLEDDTHNNRVMIKL